MTQIVTDPSWTRVAAASQIGPDTALSVQVDDRPVCLARSRGQLHALLDVCSHGQVPLSAGDVEDGTIECYLHGSRFELATGRPLSLPATQPVPTFAVRVVGDDVYLNTAQTAAAGAAP